MEEVGEVPVEAVKPKQKRTRKAFAGLEIKVGTKKYRGDSYQITTQFLIVKRGTTLTYVALNAVPSFEIRDGRAKPEGVARRMEMLATPILSAVPALPNASGGPPGAGYMHPDRNRELEALMGPSI
jgi:hypothetical protein